MSGCTAKVDPKCFSKGCKNRISAIVRGKLGTIFSCYEHVDIAYKKQEEKEGRKA